MCNGKDCRFPARIRLKKTIDFERIFRRGEVWRGKYFQFRSLETRQEARIGIAVSRRYGNAVARNRVKRMIREAFRHNKDRFYGVDVVVQPSARCKDLSTAKLEQILLSEYTLKSGHRGDRWKKKGSS